MRTPLSVFRRASARELWLTTIAIALVFGGSAPYCRSGPSGQGNEIPILSSDPWKANELIKPEELTKWLSATAGAKPLVICVAFPVLYPGGHIAGAKFAGPAAKPEGIEALKRAANGLSKDRQIVLYCGLLSVGQMPKHPRSLSCHAGVGIQRSESIVSPHEFPPGLDCQGVPN